MMDSETLRISGNINQNSSSSLLVTNTDLLIKILLCLPIKSLLVFKSVSKQWSSLISDSHFIQNHCIQNPPKVSGFIMNQSSSSSGMNTKYDFFTLDVKNGGLNKAPFETQGFMNDPFYPTEIIQSCNGLYLCCSSASYNEFGFRTYYVYNHSTKRYRIITPPLFWGTRFLDSVPVSVSCVSLAFDPLRSLDYKIVCIWKFRRVVVNYKIEIYSSETGCWRLVGDTFSTSPNVFNSSGVYWKNCLHWICFRTGTLFYFDFDQEELRTLPFRLVNGDTEMKCRHENIKYFGECVGHLYFILRDRNSPNCFDVFEMEADYKGWRSKCWVNLDGLANDSSLYEIGDDNFLCSIFPVEEVDGDEEDSKVFIHLPNKIMSYYLKKKVFVDVCDYEFDDFNEFCSTTWQHAHHYIESLANV